MVNSRNTSDIEDFIKKADKYIQGNPLKNVVLILGNTSSGKSTFTHFISDKDDNLISQQEEEEDIGVFTITDKNNEINQDYSTSVTTFPNLVVDSKKDVAYYDCPGFSDSTSITHKISLTYFIRKIIDSAETIKLVFTVDYTSFETDFLLLLGHVFDTINDIENFKDSIALVVTKVDNKKREGKRIEKKTSGPCMKEIENEGLVPNMLLITDIADSLKNIKNNLDSSKPLNNQEFNKNSLKFIDILLQKKNEKFIRIGLFRRPNRLGQVNKITLSQCNKKQLKNILHNNIQYTTPSVFQSQISDLVQKINKAISSSIVNIGKEIRKYYYLQEKQSYDIFELHKKLKIAYDALSKILTAEFTKPEELIEQMIINIVNLKITISNENFLNIEDYTYYLKFINQMSIKPMELAKGLTYVVKYLRNSQEWYRYLVYLHGVLSSYPVQKDISLYKKIANNIQDLIKADPTKTNEEKLKQLLNQLVGHDSGHEGFYNIEHIGIDEIKQKKLNKVLDLSLKESIKVYNNNTQNLRIMGEYVKLSEVRDANEFSVKSIEIFALNKIFIDDSFYKPISLSIIAPLWEVTPLKFGDSIGTIFLSGRNAGPHRERKARDGFGSGKKGYDGKPGKPGLSAGHFLGIGNTFINDKELAIKASGGEGGQGQNGGDGSPGSNGIDPTILEDKPNTCDVCKGGYYNCAREYCDDPEYVSIPGVPKTTDCHYLFYPQKRGGPGGDGGDGGRAGYRGNDGNIIMIALNKYKEMKFKVYNNHSTVYFNDGGLGGKGGMGGRSGKEIRVTCKHSNFANDWLKDDMEIISDGWERNGNNGKNGINAEGIQKPKPVPFPNPSYTINKYKSYLRENLNNNIRESVLREFLDLFENHKEVLELYDTLGLVDELQGLEDQFFKMHKDLSFLPFYESLLRRITQYADKSLSHTYSKDAAENKNVLSNLYTATLSKICSLNNNGMDNLVVNLKKYLELRIDDMTKLKELKKVTTINNFKRKYLQEIQAKQDEAKQFIDVQIMPEINRLMNQMDDNLESLIDDTIAREEKIRKDRKEFIKQQKAFEEKLALSKILGVVKVASQFLSFTGPIGTTVSSVVDTGYSLVSDSLVLDDSSADMEGVAKLPSVLETDLKKISQQFKDKQEVFKAQLQDVKEELQNKPDEELKNIQVKVEDSIKVLNVEINKKFTFELESVDKIQTMRKDVTDLLESKKEALKKKESTSGKRIKKIQHLQNLVSIGDVSLKVYNNIKNDEKKINTLSNGIKQAEKNINYLMQFEKNIYSIILPICDSLKRNVKAISENLQKQSHVALDISKWKIQSTIKDVKIQLRKMTKGFDIEDLMHCMDKLEEAMTIMTNLYNRIEDYNDKAELAAYIANINSDKALAITVNGKFNDTIDELSKDIQLNLVLEKYELAMNAIRLSIFPFADSYLGKFNLPESLKSNDAETIASTAISTIKEIVKEIDEDDATIPKSHSHIWKQAVFNSERKQSLPFYVWKHSTNKHVISKLLEGEEITVKADITQGIEKNAVKFNEIGIRLKSANNSIQQRLDDDLQDLLVNMTHLGNSYYKCDNKIYSITSNKLSLPYHYCTNNCEKPLKKNYASQQIQINDPVLSPYAMWQIKLTNDLKKFKPLSKYKKYKIDLELVGRGQYIDQDTDTCNNLDKYYTIDNAVSQLNNIDYFSEQHSDQVVPVFHNQEDHSRSRRSVNEYASIQYPENNVFMASTASSNIESSFLNNFINVIGTKLTAFKNSNLMNQISKLFINNENTTDEEEFVVLNKIIIMQELEPSSIQSLYTFLPENSKGMSRLIDYKESTSKINVINDTALYNHGSLLLLDLVNRLKSGIKYKNTVITVTDHLNLDFAQDLAYKQHIPKNKVYA